MAIFYYKNIQIHLKKDQCMRLKNILCMSDECSDFEELEYKLNDFTNKLIQLNYKEFLWMKQNLHLSRY